MTRCVRASRHPQYLSRPSPDLAAEMFRRAVRLLAVTKGALREQGKGLAMIKRLAPSSAHDRAGACCPTRVFRWLAERMITRAF
jgi:hypothetical protein